MLRNRSTRCNGYGTLRTKLHVRKYFKHGCAKALGSLNNISLVKRCIYEKLLL